VFFADWAQTASGRKELKKEKEPKELAAAL